MVKMVRDSSGRFPERPHYSPGEIDSECEKIVGGFLRARHGAGCPRITTDELSILIEKSGASLDSSVDLAPFGDDVEGMTAFFPNRSPEVSISDTLANDSRRENRLRTTLAHEYGHVHFHGYLWAEKFATSRLFDRLSRENKAICKRDTILNAREYDWMEWQAGYASGAILMPVTAIRRLVSDYCAPLGLHSAVVAGSEHGRKIIGAVTETFQVSEDAARVRLIKLNLLTGSDRQGALFH
ncbi:MAG: ImmA/IrrE family metallo-endopeptidase [Rhodospirillales bacterium]|jgi:Zn-dependent peptidase ImmA (M78 family)|nr:ImmA/IrrE family metallo-endopeptidase [Rhodospirillales bacterium]